MEDLGRLPLERISWGHYTNEKSVWVKPETVAQVAFLEWISADHLRHAKFVALRDDKDPQKIVK